MIDAPPPSGPPSLPPTPPGGAWPPGPPQPPPDAAGTRSPVVIVVIIGAVLVGLVVLALAVAIVMPAFLNQRDRAREAELTSAVRNAALEVEASATMAGGRYDAIEDFEGLVVAELGRNSDAVSLDTGSSLTGVGPDWFSICAEHRELDGSVAYVSDGGGLLDYRDSPCP